MMEMGFSLQSLGCGDAFASLGEFQSAHLLRFKRVNILLDCGATILNSLYTYKVDPNDIDVIVVSHFHGDHIGGFPFLLLKSVYKLNRVKKLKIIGPIGLKNRLESLIEAMYSGNGEKMLSQDYVEIIELEVGRKIDLEGVRLNYFEANHGNSREACGVFLTYGENSFVYSGDTSMTNQLMDNLKNAQVALLECSTEKELKGHLNRQDIDSISKESKVESILICHQSESLRFDDEKIIRIKQGEVYSF